MRILVTNDDGIHSEGLDICAEIARALSDDVWIVAPEHDQSGVAHSLSLNDPLRLRQIGDRRYAVRGTPTDCVIMGVRHVLDGKQVDLVLSGVNRGRNVGEDVIYSGTVAGAMEGALLGIPSIALSQSYKSRSGKPPFGTPACAMRPTSSNACSATACARMCWSMSIFPIARRRTSKASRCCRSGAGGRSGCTSTSGSTAATILITGSPIRCR